MHEELIDRFGLLPPPARTLLESHRLRVLGKPLGIARIDATESALQLQFIPNPPIDAGRIIELIRKNKNYKLAGQDRLKIAVDTPEVKERIAAIREIFSNLG